MEWLKTANKGGMFVNNQFMNSGSGATFETVNPADGKVICSVANCDEKDVDVAVQAARAAFVDWGFTTGAQRAVFMRAIAKELRDEKTCAELCELEALDMGKAWKEVCADVSDVAIAFDYYAGLAEKLDEDNKEGTLVVQPDSTIEIRTFLEPKGVAGAIIPWNYPLLMAAWKFCPSIAAGCTMVLKPSELTPLSMIRFAEVIQKVGLPPGVLNFVWGTGLSCGKPLASHPGLSKMAFTGSVPTGKSIMADCSRNITDLTLELGGKSAAVVLNDADIDMSLDWILSGIFWVSGQICSATSRLVVEDGVSQQLLARLVEVAKSIELGGSLRNKDKTTNYMGPVVNKMQFDKVMGFIDEARGSNDCKILCGGKSGKLESGSDDPNDEESKGYFIRPTIILVSNDTPRCWREEIFGPVLVVMVVKNEQEAIKAANNSPFALGSAVFSKNIDSLNRVARRLEAGMVWQNCSQPCPIQAPFGGNKQSGIGRELGEWGLKNFLNVKTVTRYVDSSPFKWWRASL